MASIKSFTSLEQGRKLAEILPLESADMFYQYILPKSDKIMHNPQIGNPSNSLKWHNKGYVLSGKEPIRMDEFCVPCWSLATLLSVLPRIDIEKEICFDDTYDYRVKAYIGDGYIGDWFDNPVDACVAMIEKLKELNLL